jgi:shikimate kinase
MLYDTISLVGMPGSGKSTVGVILAKLTGLRFVDTDLDIQVREQATLQTILELQGYQHLRAIEQEVLLAINLDHAVIATGGSVVYSESAMGRLKSAGVVVYLETELACLQQRVELAPPRGIASDAGQSYAEIFAERTPLYQQYADITLATDGVCAELVAALILEQLQLFA